MGYGLPRKTHVFAAGRRGVYDGKTISLFRRSLSSVPLCPDITRQKYCDWSTIEYDVTWSRNFGSRRRQWNIGRDARLPNQADRESLSFLRWRRGEERGGEKYDIFPARYATCLWNFVRFPRTIVALVRDRRQDAFDDDEVRHVEQRKEEACRPHAQCSFISVFS